MRKVSGTTAVTRSQQVQSDHRRLLFPCAPPLYDDPLVLVEGRGTIVTDAEGREFLDFFSGILTTSVGHCHPVVVERAREQMARLGHTSTLYINEPQVRAAQRLSAITPRGLTKSFFTNSGTEAVETAIMLACMHTGRSEVIALRYAYSGRSFLATNVTAQAPWRPLGSSIAGIKHAQSPYRYRSPLGDLGDERFVAALAEDLEEVIQTTTDGMPAAFFAETIQGAGGFIVPPAGYFQRMAEIIRRFGGLFIIDEVQTGFGRTGDKWFDAEPRGSRDGDQGTHRPDARCSMTRGTDGRCSG